MKPSIVAKTMRVYQVGGRVFRRRHDAFYALAKALLLAKYPPRQMDPKADPIASAAELGISNDAMLGRYLHAQRTWWRQGDGRDDPYSYFDPDLWKAYVRKVARRLAAMCPEVE